MIKWSGGSEVPLYRDYAVSMFGIESQKRVNLSIAIAANPLKWETRYSDAILNGIEIFKVNNTNGNLAGPNPSTLLLTLTHPNTLILANFSIFTNLMYLFLFKIIIKLIITSSWFNLNSTLKTLNLLRFTV